MREARLRPEYGELYPELVPGQWEPAARIAARLAELLESPATLTPQERSARSGLANRQVTIR